MPGGEYKSLNLPGWVHDEIREEAHQKRVPMRVLIEEAWKLWKERYIADDEYF